MTPSRGSTANSQRTNSSHDSDRTQASFKCINDRRFADDDRYPLPCDLRELHRQNMLTELVVKVIGDPFGTPLVKDIKPKRVLEIACGAASWTAKAAEWLDHHHIKDVEFVGLDMVSVSPDWNNNGIKWYFKEHNLANFPLPFKDGEFDLVMCKDLALVFPTDGPSQKAIEELTRILAGDGIIMCWDVDMVTRVLLPNDEPVFKLRPETATYETTTSTRFGLCVNEYLQKANEWIEAVIHARSLYTTPCSRVNHLLMNETDSLNYGGQTRVAIPLGKMRWEDLELTKDQEGIRTTARDIVTGLIDSLEPLLMEESKGKIDTDWTQWWDKMRRDILVDGGASNGECMEICATWAQKKRSAA